MEGWLTNLDTALLFYRFCQRYKIDSPQCRADVMRTITAKKKARYLRDPGPFLRGKKVLRIMPKQSSQET